MGYLVSQILLCLLVAAALGAIVGWLLHGLGVRGRLAATDSDWRNRLALTEGERDEIRGRLASLESDHAGCARKVSALESELQRATEAHAGCGDEIGGLKRRLAELEKEKVEVSTRLEEEVLALRASSAEIEKRAADTRAKAARLESELQRATEAHAGCGEEIGGLKRRLAELEKEKVEVSTRLEKEVVALRASSAEIEKRAADARARTARLESELQRATEAHAGCGEETARLRERIQVLEQRLRQRQDEGQDVTVPVPSGAETARPAWLLSRTPDEPDDLKQIRGIGPVLERTLNQLGVYQFRQIAQLREGDIAWIAKNLGSFPERIRRDNWVGQARSLHSQKYNEKI